jgi:hypothetical protein
MKRWAEIESPWRGHRILLFLVLCTAALPVRTAAQRLERTFGQDSTTLQVRHPVVRIGKWLTLGGAAGAAAYGVQLNAESDRRYTDLERLCQDSPERCIRTNTGEFAEAQLEQEYQEILKLDDRAKIALVVGQASVLTSVILFILDLPRAGTGDDIPYTPPRLHIGSDAQARLQIVYRLTR